VAAADQRLTRKEKHLHGHRGVGASMQPSARANLDERGNTGRRLHRFIVVRDRDSPGTSCCHQADENTAEHEWPMETTSGDESDNHAYADATEDDDSKPTACAGTRHALLSCLTIDVVGSIARHAYWPTLSAVPCLIVYLAAVANGLDQTGGCVTCCPTQADFVDESEAGGCQGN
jgi:hypothetical protein